MITVTSWFIDQLKAQVATPKRMFTLGGSDYSTRVLDWPNIERSGYEISMSTPRVTLTNADGYFNFFFQTLYSMAASGTQIPAVLKYGFTHPTSGDELIPIFTGQFKGISYSNDKARITCRDNLWQLEKLQVGDGDTNPVSYYNTLANSLTWSVLTSYGMRSNIASTSNPDIDYPSFVEWGTVIQAEALGLSGILRGDKVFDIIHEVQELTDSAIWIDGNGRLKFVRFSEASSIDTLIQVLDTIEIGVDVDDARIVNKQYVSAQYSKDTEFYGITVWSQSSDSMATYGLREGHVKPELLWHTSSQDANTLAYRRIYTRSTPWPRFELTTPGHGFNMDIGDTVRYVNSFFATTSATGYRIMEQAFNMNDGAIKMTLDSAFAFNGFYLDVDNLDAQDRFLL